MIAGHEQVVTNGYGFRRDMFLRRLGVFDAVRSKRLPAVDGTAEPRAELFAGRHFDDALGRFIESELVEITEHGGGYEMAPDRGEGG